MTALGLLGAQQGTAADFPESRIKKLFGEGVRYGLSRLGAPDAENDGRRGRRKAQSRAGRALGRLLLAELGAEEFEIGVAADRSPVWPCGFVGSISHSDNLVFVAVARQSAVSALGIDVEPILSTAVFRETAPLLFSECELSLIASAGDAEGMATIFFSAKEAFFKCLYPATGRFFEFGDAEILSVDLAAGRLRLRLRKSLSEEHSSGRSFDGRFAVLEGSVFSVFEQGRTSG